MIRIEINGNDIYQSEKNGGVCGEGNSTDMEIVFVSGWDEYVKKVVFYDARGEACVTVLLTSASKVPDAEKETYRIKIPSEPLKYEGNAEFVVDGSVEGARKKTVGGKFKVRYSPDSTSGNIPEEIAQSVAEQLQAEAERIGDMVVNAVPYIGENGNWFKYDPESKVYADTGVYAIGPQGEQGPKGDAGHSPQKGIDYWTDEDKEDITDEIKLPILRLSVAPDSVASFCGSGYIDSGNIILSNETIMGMWYMFPVGIAFADTLGKTVDVRATVKECEGTINCRMEIVRLGKNSEYVVLGSEYFKNVAAGDTIMLSADVANETIEDIENWKIGILYEITNAEEHQGAAFTVMLSDVKATVDSENEGNWFLWDIVKKVYVDSGISVIQGPKGEQGNPGIDGKDGHSPYLGTFVGEKVVSSACSDLTNGFSYECDEEGVFTIEDANTEVEMLFGTGFSLQDVCGKDVNVSMKVSSSASPTVWKIGIGAHSSTYEDAIIFDGAETELFVLIDKDTITRYIEKADEDSWFNIILFAVYQTANSHTITVSNVTTTLLPNENSTWYVWDEKKKMYVDTGVPATGEQGIRGEKGTDGYTPQRGVDYWTEEDKAEIKGYVDEAILGGVW